MKLPSFRHFQDQLLTTSKKKWGKKMGLCFAMFVFSTFRGPLALHDSNLYPNRSRIARYNALPTAPLPFFSVQKQDAQHKLLQHKGAHTDISPWRQKYRQNSQQTHRSLIVLGYLNKRPKRGKTTPPFIELKGRLADS